MGWTFCGCDSWCAYLHCVYPGDSSASTSLASVVTGNKVQKGDMPVFVLTDIWMQYIRPMTPKTEEKDMVT